MMWGIFQRFSFFLLVGSGLMMALTQCSDKKEPLVGERHPVLEATDMLERDPDADQFSVELSAPQNVTEWGQMGGNVTHAMPPATLKGKNRKVLWDTSIGEGSTSEAFLLSSPVAAGGYIFTVDVRGYVEARHAITGDLRWSFNTRNRAINPHHHHSGGGIAIAGDKVFIASPYGEVIALEESLGYEIWRAPLPYSARSSPAVDGERVYVTTSNNQVVAFDAVTGTSLWHHEGAAESTSLVGGATPAIYDRVVFVPYATGELFALKAENGHVLWNETLTPLRTLRSTAAVAQIRALPVAYKSVIFAVSQGDRMMAVNFRTGRRLWDRELGGIASPAVIDEFIFMITNNDQLVCLLRETGQVVWVQSLGIYESTVDKRVHRWSGPLLAEGHLVVAGVNGEILFLRPTDGSLAEKIVLSDPIKLSPIIYEGILYVLTDRGRLVAIE